MGIFIRTGIVMKKIFILMIFLIFVSFSISCGYNEASIVIKKGADQYYDLDYSLAYYFPRTLPRGSKVIEFQYVYYKNYASRDIYLELFFNETDDLDNFIKEHKSNWRKNNKSQNVQYLELTNPFDKRYVDFVEYTERQDGTIFINNRFEKSICSTNTDSFSLNAEYVVMSYSFETKTVIITSYGTSFYECPLDMMYPVYFRKFDVNIYEDFDYSEYASNCLSQSRDTVNE